MFELNEESDLYQKTLKMKPLFETNQEALDFYTKKLVSICGSRGQSKEDYFLYLESLSEMNAEDREAFDLFRRIHMLSKII